jgi:hypothetical protein
MGSPDPQAAAKAKVAAQVQQMSQGDQQQLASLAQKPGGLTTAMPKTSTDEPIKVKLRQLGSTGREVFYDPVAKTYVEYRAKSYYSAEGYAPMLPGYKPPPGQLLAIMGKRLGRAEYTKSLAGPPIPVAPKPKLKETKQVTKVPPKPAKRTLEEALGSPTRTMRELRTLKILDTYELFYSDRTFWATADWKKFRQVDPVTEELTDGVGAPPPRRKYSILKPGAKDFQESYYDPYAEKKRQTDERIKLETEGSFSIGKAPYCPLLCGGSQVRVNGEPVYVVSSTDGSWLAAGQKNYDVVNGATFQPVEIDPDNLTHLSYGDYELYWDDAPLDLNNWEFQFGVIIANWQAWRDIAFETFCTTYDWVFSDSKWGPMVYAAYGKISGYKAHISIAVEKSEYQRIIWVLLSQGRKPWSGCMADLANNIDHLTVEIGEAGSEENAHLFRNSDSWVRGPSSKSFTAPATPKDTLFERAAEFVRTWPAQGK